MKINKKLLIPVFATAMGLSVIGGITGAVAWYQYNSRVTASFVGTSVSDTGVLQIGWDGASEIEWGRDYAQMEGKELYPVTFGETKTIGGKANCLPSPLKVYHTPESGAGEGYVKHGTDPLFPQWQEATNGAQYAQFSLYFRASQTDPEDSVDGRKLVARDVYLSDFILKCVDSNGDEMDDKMAEEAIRIHMAVDSADADNHLFSKTAATDLELFGGLDLDNNGEADKYHSTLFNNKLADYGSHPAETTRVYPNDYEVEAKRGQSLASEPYYDGEEILYGNEGETQTTEALSAYLATRGTDGTITGQDEKILFTTVADEAADPIKVTFTIWMEGWATINSNNIWNPYLASGCDIQVGLRFDTGIFRGADLA